MENKICPFLTAGKLARKDFSLDYDMECINFCCALWDSKRGCCGLKKESK